MNLTNKILLTTATIFVAAFLSWEFIPWSDFSPGEKAENFTLWDQNAVSHELYYYSDAKAIVLFSYRIGCPIARHDLIALQKLRDKFSAEQVPIFLIDASQDGYSQLKEEENQFKINFPILMDSAQIIVPSLHITRSGEVLLINPKNWRIVYRGKVDDRFDYGIQKEKANNDYLVNAVNSLVQKKPQRISQTEPIGCLLDFKVPLNVSYSKQIVPILVANCVHCHNSGDVAPWAMTDYNAVKNWSPMIWEVVRTHRMPPRMFDTRYSTVKSIHDITPEEVSALVKWIETGSPRGKDPDTLPAVYQKAVQKSSEEWPLGRPDIIISKPKIKLPATGILKRMDVYVETNLKEDVWAKAIYYKPGNKKVLHHAHAFTKVISPYQTPSYILPGDPPLGIEYLAGYVPGLDQFSAPFPEGTGRFIPKGSKIFFVTHYLTTGKIEEDASQLGIYLSDKPLRPIVCEILVDQSLRIPAGSKHYEMKLTHTFKDPAILYGVGPHMHYRGRSETVTVRYPDGRVATIFSIPEFRYNFNVVAYRLKEPIAMPAGTVITFTNIFDNSAQNRFNSDPTKDAVFGWERYEEMSWGVILYENLVEPPKKFQGISQPSYPWVRPPGTDSLEPQLWHPKTLFSKIKDSILDTMTVLRNKYGLARLKNYLKRFNH